MMVESLLSDEQMLYGSNDVNMEMRGNAQFEDIIIEKWTDFTK